MDVFVYSHTIGKVARGLTNQVVAMLNHLILLEEKHVKGGGIHKAVVFLDHFYYQFNNDASRCSYSSVLDIEFLNCSFFRRLHIMDLHSIPSGTTLKLVSSNVSVDVPIGMLCSLVVDKSSVYNNYQVIDPDIGVEKTFELTLPNHYDNPVRMREYGGMLATTRWDTVRTYKYRPFLDMSGQRIESVLRDLRFASYTTSSPNNVVGEKYSLVHLRNEQDAIQWWCKGNYMSPRQFEKELNEKYLDMITKYIRKTDVIVILTSNSHSNPVSSELVKRGYRIHIHPSKKVGERELNAVQDMRMAESMCNSVLICPTAGSTFSHWLAIRLQGKYEKLVSFNISNIRSL